MDKISSDQPIQIEIPVTSNEVPVASDVTAVSYSLGIVAPEIGNTVIGSFNPQTETNKVLVDLDDHPTFAGASVFEVVYTLQTAAGDYTYRFNFMVSPATSLVAGQNSYQSYLAALLIAEEIAGIDPFKNA